MAALPIAFVSHRYLLIINNLKYIKMTNAKKELEKLLEGKAKVKCAVITKSYQYDDEEPCPKKEKNMKEYKFKTDGVIPKDCEHIVEYAYGCTLQIYLMWRLVNVCDVVLDKKTFSVYCDELGEFIEKQYQLNQNGDWILSHYSSVDMEAELLTMFLYSKFGDKIYVD